ncbi:unnamed protein product [Vitrella brassicaformis CCMP3155]|uniref:Uncharacterized protein n=1 Tax=Vitrella brassicaformis (strain CCMP3155) TaxID=1169540 RepID=A0A0G4F5I5_VITBC|nr:unnamed protein product [Vitrella brassicaformis CCMP3155]|eukprot:CEM07745.1 unnamed protein product [Vitrella brassicaformis CCMP3155]
MGGKVSRDVMLTPAPEPSSFIAICTNTSRGLCLLHFPAGLRERAIAVVRTHWTDGGNVSVEQFGGCTKLKLGSGMFSTPWRSTNTDGCGTRVAIARMLAALLHTLAQDGYLPYASTQIHRCRSIQVPDVIILRRRDPPPYAPPMDINKPTEEDQYPSHQQHQQQQTEPYFAIGLNDDDTLRLIQAPPALVDAIPSLIQQFWGGSFKRKDRRANTNSQVNVVEGIDRTGLLAGRSQPADVVDFRFNGSPWHADGDSAVTARQLMCGLLTHLWQLNYDLLCAVSLNTSCGLSTLIMGKSEGIQGDGRDIMALAMSRNDTLRLFNAPQGTPAVVRLCIERHWTRGIKSTMDSVSGATAIPCMEFRMNGNPWWCSKWHMASTEARNMMAAILEDLMQKGWLPLGKAAGSIKMTVKEADTSFMVFTQKTDDDYHGSRRATGPLIWVGLFNRHLVRVGGPGSVVPPQPVLEAIRRALQYWPTQKPPYEQGRLSCWEFRLSAGSPWHSGNTDCVHACHVVMRLFDEMYRCGWEVCAAVDMAKAIWANDQGPGSKIDCDTWFFRQRWGEGGWGAEMVSGAQ